jgi:hypothetical protein
MPSYTAECGICGDLQDYVQTIDRHADTPECCGKKMRQVIGPPQIVKDIEPYRAVAADIDGRAPIIKSRREHREFLKRNGYVEIGNDVPKPKKYEPLDKPGNDIKRAIKEVMSR